MTGKEQHPEKNPAPARKNGRRRIVLWGGPLIMAIVGGYLYFHGARFSETDNAYLKAAKVSISSEVSGKVLEVAVHDNQQVEKDAVLFRIDPAPFEIAVLKAESGLATVRSEIESLKSEYLQKNADFEKAQENLNYQEKQYARAVSLREGDAVSVTQFDEIENSRNESVRALESARQEAGTARAKLVDPELAVEEHPLYKEALAQMNRARLDFQRTSIKAPTAGMTANVSMQPGEYIAAGIPLFSIVDNRYLWVEANFKETDLTYVKRGQPATVEVDTYPGKVLKARVESITPATGAEFSILPAQNSSGNWVKVVQRIMVRLELDDKGGDLPLAAGMSATVGIDTGNTRIERMRGKADGQN